MTLSSMICQLRVRSSQECQFSFASCTTRPTGFVAGTSHLTVADISLAANVTTISTTGIVPLSDYPELPAWFGRVRASVPNYERANGEGANTFAEWYRKRLAEGTEGK